MCASLCVRERHTSEPRCTSDLAHIPQRSLSFVVGVGGEPEQRIPGETMGQSIEPGQALVLRTDGGSRGNPGPAAAGVIIEDATGRVVARGRRFLGHMTNNQAEYRALILGLKAIAGYRPRQVTIYLDSELVVNQMNGRYRVRDELLRPLYEEAKSIAAALPGARFAHVPRAQNRLADALANEALDAHAAERSGPGSAAQHRPAGDNNDLQ